MLTPPTFTTRFSGLATTKGIKFYAEGVAEEVYYADALVELKVATTDATRRLDALDYIKILHEKQPELLRGELVSVEKRISDGQPKSRRSVVLYLLEYGDEALGTQALATELTKDTGHASLDLAKMRDDLKVMKEYLVRNTHLASDSRERLISSIDEKVTAVGEAEGKRARDARVKAGLEEAAEKKRAAEEAAAAEHRAAEIDEAAAARMERKRIQEVEKKAARQAEAAAAEAARTHKAKGREGAPPGISGASRSSTTTTAGIAGAVASATPWLAHSTSEELDAKALEQVKLMADRLVKGRPTPEDKEQLEAMVIQLKTKGPLLKQTLQKCITMTDIWVPCLAKGDASSKQALKLLEAMAEYGAYPMQLQLLEYYRKAEPTGIDNERKMVKYMELYIETACSLGWQNKPQTHSIRLALAKVYLHALGGFEQDIPRALVLCQLSYEDTKSDIRASAREGISNALTYFLKEVLDLKRVTEVLSDFSIGEEEPLVLTSTKPSYTEWQELFAAARGYQSIGLLQLSALLGGLNRSAVASTSITLGADGKVSMTMRTRRAPESASGLAPR